MAMRHLRADVPTDLTLMADGRWRAASPGLGLYAYGATPDEATHHLLEQLNALADFYESHNGLKGLKDRFSKAGIDLVIEEGQEGSGKLPLLLAFGKVLQHA